MKNPFIKVNNTGLWIAATVGGAIAAATGIWLHLRGKRAAELEAYRREHAQDYLQQKKPQKKKHKTDQHELGELICQGQ